ncbi:hypothetical protein CYLTODRAFT_395974 [Cylindrobasidium torrendii FP15055 ss-10]|uniref:Tricalbin n=1 Tax=Cylindrobasidium torrendii FP15055 ss-10 TaxID=1314674 RepID=A0A0D7BD57_9AGAR|nr:hypothetical protein CYLTODRAFT_395974 [Cylindrobasidium torrendii FP15055 ss-10]
MGPSINERATDKDDSTAPLIIEEHLNTVHAGSPLTMTKPAVADTDFSLEPNEAATKSDSMNDLTHSTAPPGGFDTTVRRDCTTVGWHQLAAAARKDGALETFISEHYYGEWFHNAGIILTAVLVTYILGRLNIGVGSLFIVSAFCSTAYSTSIRRTRRNARDDIRRELVKTRMESEAESAHWINNFMDRFWPIYEPVLSASIVESVDQTLATSAPGFVDFMRLSTFTLGNKAPRIDAVHTFPRTEEDIVVMDWGFSFTPKDLSDMTPNEAADKVNPKVVLSVRVKGITFPILVEDITFSGRMRVRMKLMPGFPHVQTVDIAFLEKPVIDYVLKPLGGETFGFDIANIPGMSSSIRDMTHATLGPMMYSPNTYTLNVQQMFSGEPADSAIGVLQVTVHSARGIKGTKIGGGTPDPYVGLSLNHGTELARTKYKANTFNPTWSETKFVPVSSLGQVLDLDLWDYNDHRKNSHLGTVQYDLRPLLEDATQDGLASTVTKDGRERGELRYDVSFFPVLRPEDGEDVADTTVGIVRLNIHQAKDLDPSSSINPAAFVYVDDSRAPNHRTRTLKHTNKPVWESSHEYICSHRSESRITIQIQDDDKRIGWVTLGLEDVLSATTSGAVDWFCLEGGVGKVRLSAEWKPLNMAGSLHGAERYTPPIGVVRLFVEKATDVKNVEGALGGKSDPYTRVQVANVTLGRTEVINNNLNPVWKQFIYIPVHTLKETLLLECMDYQHLTKDRSLGSIELRVADLAVESDEDTMKFPYKSTGTKTAADPLRQDESGEFKGLLHYRAEFVPAMKLKGLKFDGAANEIDQVDPNQDADGGDATDDEDGEVVGRPAVATHLDAVETNSDGASSRASTTVYDGSQNGDDAEGADQEGIAKEEDTGLEMSIEELLSQPSGIIIFNVMSGELSKKARVEVLLDNGYWPCFATTRARGKKMQWNYTGEGFVKELDFGQVWLRLNEADEGEKDDIIGQWRGDAKVFLRAAMEGPQTYTLTSEDCDRVSTVTLEARYVPVPVTLEARESVNNQGTLRMTVLRARDLPAVDRSGTSDPFTVVTINDQKVFKSQTKKKTLNPHWNEDFTAVVSSRVDAECVIEVWDWNQIEQAESLGSASINLAELEPFQSVERDINLTLASAEHSGKSRVRVRLLFQPGMVIKSRRRTSTFSSAGRAMTTTMTTIGGLPLHAGKGVIRGLTGLVMRRPKEARTPAVPPSLPPGQASHPARPGQSASSLHLTASGSNFIGVGSLKVTALNAKDFAVEEARPYLKMRLGNEEFKTTSPNGKTAMPEWNESFSFATVRGTSKLHISLFDHRALGKDAPLGEGEVDIGRHISSAGSAASSKSADVLCELQGGQGLVRLRLELEDKPPVSQPEAKSQAPTRRLPVHMPSSLGRLAHVPRALGHM